MLERERERGGGKIDSIATRNRALSMIAEIWWCYLRALVVVPKVSADKLRWTHWLALGTTIG